MEQNNLPVNLDIRSEDLPAVISSAVGNVVQIGDNIKEAAEKAELAQNAADVAAEKSAGWSLWGRDKREAIEALQTAALELSSALSKSVDASRVLFENQKQMIQAIRYLFGLGVANIAANRTIVRELEYRLRFSGKRELSDLARQEIRTVVLQLRAQEDVLMRLDNHDEIFREHRDKINQIIQSHSGILSEIESIRSTVRDINAKISGEGNRPGQISLGPNNPNETQNGSIFLAKRSFFDSILYKIAIGLIAIAALICSIVL